MSIDTLIQSVFNGLMAGWLYILVALGLTLILSITGILQLAHGEIYMLGAYFTFLLATRIGLNFFMSLILAAIVISFFGVILERIFFRPFRGGVPDRPIIIAMALMLILQNTVTLTFGGETKGMESHVSGVLSILGVNISWERAIIIIVGVILVSALILLIKKTKMGQAMLAVSQNLEAASLQGISIDRISSLAMFFGCFMATVAGALVGATFNLYPSMGSFALMKGIAVIILGGLGSIYGTVIGGLILGLVDGIFPVISTAQMASMIGFVVVIIILIFRPQGLMGHE